MLGGLGHSNLSLQMQQQQQQQAQQQQQPGQNQPGQQQQQNAQGPPPNGQDYNLSNVLHFLQTEWRRYERDRNEWEIERAEMRARIALLEGERRSFENVKLDLMRRIKMLEYALRVERSKQLNQPAPAIPPQKAASLQGKDDGTGSHKEGSSGSSPRSEDSPLPGGSENNRLSIGSLGGLANGTSQAITGSASASAPISTLAHAGSSAPNPRPQTWAGMPNNALVPTAVGKPPPGRDAKGRARSRDYLKQCLQEVNYLTSPQALNPLPNRPLLSSLSMTNAQAQPLQAAPTAIGPQQQQQPPQQLQQQQQPNMYPLSLPNLPAFDHSGQQQQSGQAPNPANSGSLLLGRPRKIVPEIGKDYSALNGLGPGPPLPLGSIPNSQHSVNHTGNLSTSPPNVPPPNPHSAPHDKENSRIGLGPGSPLRTTDLCLGGDRSDGVPGSEGSGKHGDDVNGTAQAESDVSQITAIFRPDAAGEWRERLRAAHEAVERAKAEEDLQGLTAASLGAAIKDEDEETTEDDPDPEAMVSDGKLWKPRRTLRNHLDAVRALTFHPSEMCLVTGGDDFTIKIWRMDATDLASGSQPSTDIEPQLTLRGHSSSVTRLVISGSKNLLYSASLDATIRIWAIPPTSYHAYSVFDQSKARGTLVGHTDAVWDLALLREDSLLVSGGADGNVKVWDLSMGTLPSLKLSWGYHGAGANEDEPVTEMGVTSLDGIKTDLRKVAVAYRNSIVKLFDIDTGAETMKLQSDATYDGTPATQINKIVSHPTMSLLITAHEDKYIRLFDTTTGQCTHSMLGHLEGVTSLSIDASGFSLVSGGHDCSVRFWDLLGSRACLQEMTNHRKKADEGVLDVEYHQTLPFLASAGADGVVKLCASS